MVRTLGRRVSSKQPPVSVVMVVVKSSVLSQRLRGACQQISDNLQANVSAWNQRGKEQYVVEQLRPHTAESLTSVDPKNGE